MNQFTVKGNPINTSNLTNDSLFTKGYLRTYGWCTKWHVRNLTSRRLLIPLLVPCGAHHCQCHICVRYANKTAMLHEFGCRPAPRSRNYTIHFSFDFIQQVTLFTVFWPTGALPIRPTADWVNILPCSTKVCYFCEAIQRQVELCTVVK